MPRRVTPFQVRLEIYVRSQLAKGRSANDVAREDLGVSAAMLADYRSGDSLPNARDIDRAVAFQRLLRLAEPEWFTLIGESTRVRAEDDRVRETELQKAVQSLAPEVERDGPFRPKRGAGGAAAETPRPSVPTAPQPAGGQRPIKNARKHARTQASGGVSSVKWPKAA